MKRVEECQEVVVVTSTSGTLAEIFASHIWERGEVVSEQGGETDTDHTAAAGTVPEEHSL